ncbi:MAG: hypothetical protein ABEL76_14770 [Bradymonadaceae bacterium]
MSDVFEGECRLCGEVYGLGMTNHLQSCISTHADIAATSTGLYLSARADGPTGRFWLHLLISPETGLGDVDAFLRGVWFDDDRLSQFEVGDVWHVSDPDALADLRAAAAEDGAESSEATETDQGGDDESTEAAGENDGDDGDEGPTLEAMDRPFGAVARPRMEFDYRYDPLEPTTVELKVYDPYPVPDDLEASEVEGVFVLARNEEPAFDCASCGAPAEYLHPLEDEATSESPDEDAEQPADGESSPADEGEGEADGADDEASAEIEPTEEYLCGDCADGSEDLRPLFNSPRSGMSRELGTGNGE